MTEDRTGEGDIGGKSAKYVGSSRHWSCISSYSTHDTWEHRLCGRCPARVMGRCWSPKSVPQLIVNLVPGILDVHGIKEP